MRLIILPQALKISIPGIVNTFIGLFKDTTLVVVIGLLDPLGLLAPITADQNWNGIVWELYGFIALFFFIFCFLMSRYSMHLERRLRPGTIRSGGEPMSDSANGSGRGPLQGEAVRIAGMSKWFGEFHVLRDIDLTVARGERIVICGPSGSGKSTLIRCINRLEEHQRGEIVVNGVLLDSNLKHIDQIRSEVGMVFQSFTCSRI